MSAPWVWQEASFREVKFRFKTAGASLGRRNVVHTYPGRDEVYVEDMGRKTREFTFEAFVIGDEADNYLGWRDKLEAACELGKGPGELVHPTRGRMVVAVQECRPSESIDQLGLAGFSLTFIEAGPVDMAAGRYVRVDTPSLVAACGATVVAACLMEFPEGAPLADQGGFSLEDMPAFVEADALATITSALDEITAVAQGMLPDMSLLPALNIAAHSITDRLTTLMRIPTDLAAELSGQIAGLRLVALAPLSAYQALAKLFDFGKGGLPLLRTTPARIALADNRAAVQTLVRRVALAEAATAASEIRFADRDEATGVRAALVKATADYARTNSLATGNATSGATTEARMAQVALVEATAAAARISYASREEALALRDDLVGRLEAEAETASEAVYAALYDLRTAVVEDIGARSVNLPRRVSYTPQATLPAVVLAWRLYGDPEMDVEIVARNRVRHPGFVPGGRALEVLL